MTADKITPVPNALALKMPLPKGLSIGPTDRPTGYQPFRLTEGHN